MSLLVPGSVTWRIAGDARVLPFLGRAFLLQAAHPTIAAGVAEHSTFQQDPFGRFHLSYGLVLETVYAPDDSVGRDVRRAHRSIRGVKPDGSAYHAFEPEAYFWVVATGFEAFEALAGMVLPERTLADRRRGFAEMVEVGRRFGLRDRDMPETRAAFDEWYAWMLAERLEDSQTVRDVLRTVRRPRPPAGVPDLAWPLPREAVGRLAWLATVGTLPAAVRERLNIPWSRAEEAQFAVLARAYRPLWRLPEAWFTLPPKRAGLARPVAVPAAAEALAA